MCPGIFVAFNVSTSRVSSSDLALWLCPTLLAGADVAEASGDQVVVHPKSQHIRGDESGCGSSRIRVVDGATDGLVITGTSHQRPPSGRSLHGLCIFRPRLIKTRLQAHSSHGGFFLGVLFAAGNEHCAECGKRYAGLLESADRLGRRVLHMRVLLNPRRCCF